MYDYIVQHFLRGEDETPVEVEIAFAATASPAGFLLPDGDAPVRDTHDVRVVFCLAGEGIPRDGDVSGTVLFGQRRTGWSRAGFSLFLKFRKMLFYPVFFFTDKGVDIRTGAASGRPDNDSALWRDLERKGFAAAVYDLIIE